MIKRVISGLIIGAVTICALHAQSQTVTTEKKRHLIYLIHGIGGDHTTFPNMAMALKTNLRKYGPSDTAWDVRTFLYETGNHKKNVYEFAKDLNSDIDETFKRIGGLRDTDKLSFVMHSQGGLVGVSWVFNAAVNNPKFYSKYVSHMDAFISLGSPFWGTKQALWAEQLKEENQSEKNYDFTLNPIEQMRRGLSDLAQAEIIQNALSSFGSTEMRDMALGSNKLFDFRNGAIKVLSQKELMDRIKSHVRVFNIGSYIPVNSILSTFVPQVRSLKNLASGRHEIENDGAVIIPSSRFDFIYGDANQPGYSYDQQFNIMDFTETDFGKYTVVPALHVNPIFPKKLFGMDSLAQIPAECIEDLNCEHPTFKLIYEHLLNRKVKLDNPHIAKMTSFLVDMNVILPLNSKVKASDLEVDILDMSKDVKAMDPYELSSYEALDAREFSYHPSIYGEAKGGLPHWSQYKRVYFTGSVINSYNPNMKNMNHQFHASSVRFRISAPGMKPRVINALVRPTKTTYINLNLESL